MSEIKVRDRVIVADGKGKEWHGTVANISDYREPSMKYAVWLDEYDADYVFVGDESIRKEADNDCEELKDTIVYIATTRTFTDSFGEEMGIDEEVAKGLADALIAAGLTFEPMTFRIVENKPYSYTAGELANWKEDQDRIAKLLHRAEVAERALDKAVELAYEYRTEADTLSCSSCPMGDELFPKCKDRGLYKECSKRWKEQLIEQTEKELAEEAK